ncbi:MAG TPA: HAD family hydrolase [Brevefilum sp.]|nr:HAD family hydrolase [Brevefilum sp.]HOR18905.1 HAD family hydrolase [Brevefilum sp.]HPL70014.1 HAD family hydrolase [Brevefilum sp.]
MPLTVLFDLDDTLLSTHMDRFLPLYFDLLGQTLSHLGRKEFIASQIHIAVEMMIANRDPAKTLKEVFDENFYPQLGTTSEACQPLLDAFYQQQYPRIKSVVQARPESPDLVKWCLSEGMPIAIATNPLFPHTATYQRIQWSGLNPEDFVLFTAYDDFHFTKPNLAYYAEILGRMGWPEMPAVMIGDNPSDDLFPMDTFGFETFWIKQENQEILWEGGSLVDVKSWLQQVIHTPQRFPTSDPLVNIATLRATPAVFDTWIRAEPDWGPNVVKIPPKVRVVEVLGSLIWFEEQVHLNLGGEILSGKIRDFTIHQSPSLGEYPDREGHNANEMLARFITARKSTLSQVEEFYLKPSKGWDRKFAQTVNDFLYQIADHDRQLLRQAVIL